MSTSLIARPDFQATPNGTAASSANSGWSVVTPGAGNSIVGDTTTKAPGEAGAGKLTQAAAVTSFVGTNFSGTIAAASSGATTVTFTPNATGVAPAVGGTIVIGSDSRTITAVSGSGTYTVTLSAALSALASAGATATITYPFFATAIRLYLDGTPTSSLSLFRGFTDAGYATNAFTVQVTTTRKINVGDPSGTTQASTPALTTGTWYTIVLSRDTTDANIILDVYADGSTTSLFTLTANVVVAGGIGSVRAGQVSATNAAVTIHLGSVGLAGFAHGDATTARVARADLTNAAPVITAGPTQAVQVGTPVTLTFGATDDVAVSALSAAISGPTTPTLSGSATGLGGTSANYSPTFTPNAVGKYVVTATATDGSAATGTGSTIVYSYAASGTSADPVAASAGTGTVVGAGSALASITGTAAPATKYLEGPSGGGAFAPITLPPLGPGGITIPVEGYYNAGALNRTANFYKADGSTLVYSDTWALAASDTNHDCIFDATALAGIPNPVDRGELIMKVTDA